MTIPAKAAISQVHLANMVPKLCSPVWQMSTKANQEEDGSCKLEKVVLGRLQQWKEEQQHNAKKYLCKLADILFQNDFNSSECNI